MTDINDVFDAAIQVVTDAVPELHGYSVVVQKLETPAIMAFPVDRIEYQQTMMGDEADLWFTFRLFVDRKTNGDDQRLLNTYISPTGSNSVIKAIKDSPRLGGVVADAAVVESSNYGNWPVGTVTYLGVEIRVRAMIG